MEPEEIENISNFSKKEIGKLNVIIKNTRRRRTLDCEVNSRDKSAAFSSSSYDLENGYMSNKKKKWMFAQEGSTRDELKRKIQSIVRNVLASREKWSMTWYPIQKWSSMD